MFKKFKEFAFKGNMFDLAVGIMIGGAFNKIVSSLVNDIFMPIIGVFTGKVSFENLFITLSGEKFDTLAAAKEAGANVINVGGFITTVLDFFIIAIVVFLFLNFLSKFKSKQEEEHAEPTTKECPFCKNQVAISATRCGFCTSELSE